MKRMIGLVAGVFLLAPGASALNKEWVEYHLRSSMNIDSRTTLSVGDPEPSDFGGLLKVPLTIGGQEAVMYVTPDEKRYIVGNVFDLTIDPDKSRMEKMDFSHVHYKGSKKAKVTIVEFSDLQCGYCKRAHLAISDELYKTYSKSQVRLVFKHFPLSFHKWSKPAAIATECAGAQKKKAFWEMASEFFKNSQDLKPENVEEKAQEFARASKLNMKKFRSCFETEETYKLVKANMDEGRAVGVSSTPTFFVNGRLVRGFRDFKTLKSVIDEKLNAKK